MLRGLYTAASGMLATQTATDTLANNLANVNTAGFKGNKVNYQSFPEMLISRMSDQGAAPVGSIMTGSHIQESRVDFQTGPMTVTGNTFDMALEGDGFFTVKSGNGQTYYTRAGNFTVNPQGYLTTVSGDKVQGELGDILLSLDQGPFHITTSGEIMAKGSRMIDRLKIARFDNNRLLEKVGDTLYTATPAAKLQAAPPNAAEQTYKVYEGTLEQSNVNPIAELVSNIQGMRLYEALQKNIHMHNETLGRAVNDVGRTK